MFSAVGLQSITKTRSPRCSSDGQDRVVAAKQHVVIQVVVDPLLDGLLDVAKIDQHASRVEIRALEGDDGTAVVPMKVTAFAVVVEQPVAVAKLDLARDSKHDRA